MTTEISPEKARTELAYLMRDLRQKSGHSIAAAAERVFTEERFIQLLETPGRDVRALSPTVPGRHDRSFDTSYYRVRELCEKVYATDADTTKAAQYLFLIGDAVSHEYRAQIRSNNASADERTLMNGAGCIAFPLVMLLTVGTAIVTGNPLVALAVFLLGAPLVPFLVKPMLHRLPGSNSNPLSAEQELERDIGMARDWLAQNHRFVQAGPGHTPSVPGHSQPAEANVAGRAPAWARASATAPNSSPPPGPSHEGTTHGLYEALLQLNELRERGLLTEQEFVEQKARLLQPTAGQHRL